MSQEKDIARFSLEDGTTFLVEVDEPASATVERVSINTGQLVYDAKETLEAALDKVKPVAATIVDRMQSGLTTPADEVSVTFGLKLSAAAGVIFGSVGGERAVNCT
jgi:hypothetical protein